MTKRQLGRHCPELGTDGHGAWYVALPATGGTPGAPKRLRHGGYPSRTEAETVLRRLLNPALATMDRGLTVEGWLTQWMKNLEGRLRPTTVRGYRKHVDQYLIPLLGGELLCALTHASVQRAFHTIVQQHQAAGLSLSGATVRRIHATLSSALSAACRAGLLDRNPARQLDLPKAPPPRPVVWTDAQVEHWQQTGTRPAVAVWTASDTARFLSAIRHHRLYALYHLYTLRGLRRGESLGLRWSDIDLDARTLNIRCQLQKHPGGVFEDCPTKTASSARQVALDHHTAHVLAAHRRRQLDERSTAGEHWTDTGYAFTDQRGLPLAPDHVGHTFQQLIRTHDLPPIRLHDLRHIAATLAVNAGVQMKVVQHQVGHDSMTTTADTYTSVLPETARQAAEATARLLNNAARQHQRLTHHLPRIRSPHLRIRAPRPRPPRP
ncbi:tyrosine-type recombinase/integrase [Streptacidiphilus sp. P02-A3a]|uniref:tyrosine-type recombinase/integrase n=1 Tax=Streptacidiphilus sp. P02-A3a TaxID=2704468 RepID=UPI0015F83F75|nr:tyrosine-type recombinase/integrase [Streptacidiphilus sp. P02-A3a]QMU73228.1 site-specific integrase [Streptacidiphilus sp. P02-A3a]